MQCTSIIARNVHQEVVVIEGLELDFHPGHLHDFVDLAILFPRNEIAMLIGQLDLKTDLVMKVLRSCQQEK